MKASRSTMVLSLILVLELLQCGEKAASEANVNKEVGLTKKCKNRFTSRLLLQSSADGGDANRIGNECSKDDIVISQGTTSPLFNGIPSYTVRILNECASDCYMCNIHVNCGWFSSARLVNPEIFQRIAYNDCLVNGGEPLGPGETIYFEYSNILPYQLTVSSADCC